MNSATGTPGHIPWRTLAIIGLICFFSATGRVAVIDGKLMLEQSRSFLAGRVHLASSGGLPSIPGADGREYCPYNPLTSIYWAPFVVSGRVMARLAPSVPLRFWEEFMVSFAASLPVLVLLGYLAWEWCRIGMEPRRVIWGLVLVGLGTNLWPYAKISMSDPIMALCVFAAYCHWQRSDERNHAVASGVWLGLALLSRRQAEAILPVMALFLIWKPDLARRAQRLGNLAAGFVPVLLVQLWYNWVRWGSPFKESYVFGRTAVNLNSLQLPQNASAFWKGSWNCLFGEASGLFLFNVWLLLLLLVVIRAWWREGRASLLLTLGLLGSQIVFLSFFNLWRVGTSFGARYLLYLIPFLALGWRYWPRSPHWGLRLILGAFVGLSVGIQILGVATDAEATYKRRELYLAKDAWILTAHWGEFNRVLGLDRTPPPADVPGVNFIGKGATTYWEHPSWQVPDVWWCQMWRYFHTNAQPPAKAVDQ